MIEHLSHSSLESLAECGEKFRLRKVQGVPGIPMWAGVAGKAIHTVTECHDWRELGLDRDVPSFDEEFTRAIEGEERLSGVARAEWYASGRVSREWPNKQDERWWRHHGQGMCTAWVNFTANSPWRVAVLPDGQPAVELEFRVEVGGVPVVGYIDRIMEDVAKPDVLAVVDIKSSAREPKSDRQLGLYSLAMRQVYGLDIRWGFYFMVRTGATTAPVDLRRYWDGRLAHDFRAGWRAVEHGVFLPSPSDMCRACSVRRACREFGGEAAGAHLPYEAEVEVA